MSGRSVQNASDDAITDERLERAFVFAAHLVSVYGEKVVPFFERLETEIIERRRRPDPMERARRLLEAHTLDVTRKAIR